jgi:hypothetical protein
MIAFGVIRQKLVILYFINNKVALKVVAKVNFFVGMKKNFSSFALQKAQVVKLVDTLL